MTLKRILFLSLFVLGSIFWMGARAGENSSTTVETVACKGILSDKNSGRFVVDPSLDITELVSYVLAAYESPSCEKFRTIFLLKVKEYQFLASKENFGNFRWRFSHSGVNDLNAVEFAVRKLSLIALKFGERLTDSDRRLLNGVLEDALTSVKAHVVPISYTNIYLMRSWNLLVLGAYLADSVASKEGVDNLEKWVSFTKVGGISEYLSPTYYAVDLEVLSLIKNVASDPKVVSLASNALDLIWSDVLFNWYLPSARLAGPHSRDYDVLHGRGDIDNKVRRVLATSSLRAHEDDDLYSRLSWSPPSEKVLANYRRLSYPRSIVYRSNTGAVINSYIDSNSALGSTSALYGSGQDVPFNASLGSGWFNPQITFAFISDGDFYRNRVASEARTDHLKNFNKKFFFFSSQKNNQLFVVAQPPTDPSPVSASFVLPKDAEYWVGDRLVRQTGERLWVVDPPAKVAGVGVRGLSSGFAEVFDRSFDFGIGAARFFDAVADDFWHLKVSGSGKGLSLYLNFYDANYFQVGSENKVVVDLTKNPDSAQLSVKAPLGTKFVKAWIYSSKSNVSVFSIDRIVAGVHRGNSVPVEFVSDSFSSINKLDGLKIPLPAGSILFVRKEGAALAIKPLDGGVGSVDHQDFQLIDDGDGLNTLRLTSSLAKNDNAFYYFWIYLNSNVASDSDFAKFRDSMLTADVAVDNLTNGFDLSVKGTVLPLKIKCRFGKRSSKTILSCE